MFLHEVNRLARPGFQGRSAMANGAIQAAAAVAPAMAR
jgi:hypothetical protein